MNVDLPPPADNYEKTLEIKVLTFIQEMIEEGMPLQSILNVLERARHLTTEIMVELEQLGVDNGKEINR